MDLIRQIALWYEDKKDEIVKLGCEGLRKNQEGRSVEGQIPDIEGFSDSEIRYAISIMVDGGMIIESREPTNTKPLGPLLGRRLGWYGHKFLDSVRDESIYKRTKSAAGKAGNWTFGFVVEVAKRLALKELGL